MKLNFLNLCKKSLILPGIILLSLYLLPVEELEAQLWMPPGRQFMQPPDPFTFDAGVNKFNNDYYLYLAPTLNLNFGGEFGLSLTAPMNFLAYDQDPKDPTLKVGSIRKIDYDQKSDYLRLINNIWYGTYGLYKPGETTFSFYAGKLFDGYIGHGTIVNRYVNNQRIDIYNVGLMADFNNDYGGVQVFTNSVYTHEIGAARGYVRPFAIAFKLFDLFTGRSQLFGMLQLGQGNVADEAGRKKVYEEAGVDPEDREKYRALVEDQKTHQIREEMIPIEKKPESRKEKLKEFFNQDNFANRFSIGYTTAFDTKAPTQLAFDTTGRLRLDSNNNPLVEQSEKLVIQGMDAEYKLISTKYIEITPYYDVNTIKILNSKGTHTGAMFRFGGKDIYAKIKPEYRNMDANYIPMYFDSFYELERYQANVNSQLPVTKLEAAKLLDPDAARLKGYFTSVVLSFYRISLEANYENYSGPNNSRIFVGLYFPIGSLFMISGYYTRKNFDQNKDAFKVDDNSVGAIEAALNLGFIAIRIQDIRRWVYDSTSNSFVAQDEQKVLFSNSLSF
ncbi:cytoplasmic membrane protein ImpL63 [Leptospira venezuelensis]|uniref:cytoplasmic membrane protein ImpL63 n=1 Tax=Leptospira venezuelensis TaxID=1958811 RepID=UPI000A3CD186